MSFESDLRNDLRAIFGTPWQTREGKVVPEAEDVKLGNDAVLLDAAVLYADLADSTEMVKTKKPEYSAEVYKAYLASACKVIRNNGGTITSFDGDRVMAVFIGPSRFDASVRTALNISWTTGIILEEMKKKWSGEMNFSQAVGVDTTSLFVAKTGIRGSDDLVWVGPSANLAAKLASRREGYASYITGRVFDNLSECYRISTVNGWRENIWNESYWNEQSLRIYRSTWWFQPF